MLDAAMDEVEGGAETQAPSSAASVGSSAAEPGFIDICGYSVGLSGWLFCGWIALTERDGRETAATFTADFDSGQVSGDARIAFFEREDLHGRGVGVIVFGRGAPTTIPLSRLTLTIRGADFTAMIGDRSMRLRGPSLVERLRPIATSRLTSPADRETFTGLLARIYPGYDTLLSLHDRARLEIDAAVVCPPDGLLLIGWRLFAPGAVSRVRVCCGDLATELALGDFQLLDRPDVIAAGVSAGLTPASTRCGFLAHVAACLAPTGVTPWEDTYLEVETTDGQVGFRTLRRSNLSGIGAIKRLLHDADVRFDELDQAFDKVLGPAVMSLNRGRLARPVAPCRLDFGAAPERPRCSVIVPLFGRIDFLEYQMALFSEAADLETVEFIYVLDDPPRRRELENLAQSVFARFEVPFSLLLLPENLGFAPANNQGLKVARGEYVCFLNSDAFPDTRDWIGRLIADLERRPDIGVIGPRLLFEDGSIQHEGCVYRPLKEFGGWMYVDHDGRGRRPGPERGLREVPAITGACMLMRRALADDLGGFDEAYIIGDFEDSDLCKKVQARDLACAVDRDVSLYHLERQSQAASRERWRQSLTLYNAWVHQRRWFPSGHPL